MRATASSGIAVKTVALLLSYPSAAPHRSAMSVPSPVPSFPPAVPRSGSPVAGFWLDLLIAVATLLGLSMLCGLAWGAWRGVEVGLELVHSGNAAPTGADVAKAMGTPGALAQLLMRQTMERNLPPARIEFRIFFKISAFRPDIVVS